MASKKPKKRTTEYKALHQKTKERYYVMYSAYLQGAQMWQIAKKMEVNRRTVERAIKWCRESIPSFTKDDHLRDALQRTENRLLEVNKKIRAFESDALNARKYTTYCFLQQTALKLEDKLEKLQGLAYHIIDTRYKSTMMHAEEMFDPQTVRELAKDTETMHSVLDDILDIYMKKLKGGKKDDDSHN